MAQRKSIYLPVFVDVNILKKLPDRALIFKMMSLLGNSNNLDRSTDDIILLIVARLKIITKPQSCLAAKVKIIPASKNDVIDASEDTLPLREKYLPLILSGTISDIILPHTGVIREPNVVKITANTINNQILLDIGQIASEIIGTIMIT
jgi:hypothetical protein